MDDSIILALGGNLAWQGRSVADTLEAALEVLAEEGVQVSRRSRLWRSAAWPDTREPAYLNQVAWAETALLPDALLATLHAVEARFGRVRGRPNASRPLDLDLIAYGRRVSASTPLLPHPRAAERLFVMGPLAEIAPGWRHPVLGRTAAELSTHAAVGCDAMPELLPAP